jgi:DNA-binding response OmpR family regulator
MALDQLTETQLPVKPKQMIKKWMPQIIIVDDDFELLEELKDGLSSNYYVETLSNSNKAFDIVYKLKPDLIILDIKMSPKTGFQLANEFTNFERTKFIPIIFITGFYVEKEHPLMKLLGMKHIMIKPFGLNQLIEKIENVLIESI